MINCEDGPFRSTFECDTKNVIRREIITYRMKNGILVKEQATRDYYPNGDYQDTANVLPLPNRNG